MAQDSYPWDETGPGDAGPYSSQQWADAWRNLFQGSLPGQYNSGILPRSGDGVNGALSVAVTSPTSVDVRIFSGAAIVAGRFYSSTATETQTIATNASGNPRIDRIVLRVVFADQTIRLHYLQGTPAASPSAPALTQTNVIFEIPLAQILVPSGFLTITGGITDERVPVTLPTSMGGLGFSSQQTPFVKGDIIAANAADTLVARNIPNWNWLWGNSAASGGVSAVDGRPHTIFVDTVTVGAAAVTVPFTAGNMYNPASYITSLGANQFRLAAGSYIVSGSLAFSNTNAAVAHLVWALINTAAPTVALALSLAGRAGALATNSGGGTITLPETIITFDGTETLEIQAQRIAGAATVAVTAGLVATFGTGLSGYLQFKRIK